MTSARTAGGRIVEPGSAVNVAPAAHASPFVAKRRCPAEDRAAGLEISRRLRVARPHPVDLRLGLKVRGLRAVAVGLQRSIMLGACRVDAGFNRLTRAHHRRRARVNVDAGCRLRGLDLALLHPPALLHVLRLDAAGLGCVLRVLFGNLGVIVRDLRLVLVRGGRRVALADRADRAGCRRGAGQNERPCARISHCCEAPPTRPRHRRAATP